MLEKLVHIIFRIEHVLSLPDIPVPANYGIIQTLNIWSEI